ncbi:MAG TPA: hypothetical protein VMX16_15385 [Terriglobia bacterium]|nr:hypothetical protein [Terriglobia bacterium]
MLEPHSVVVATFVAPRERIWGELVGIRPEGVTLRGIGLDSFEEFLQQSLREGKSEVCMSTAFYPMHRVERIALDEPLGLVGSLSDTFRDRVGMTIQEYLGIPETR